MLGVRVNRNLAPKVVSLSGRILEISDKPLIGDVVLLAFPTFGEQSRPDHNKECIEDAQR